MATVQVQSNGVAPAGLKAGDVVKTAGRDFQIVNAGTPGASYSEKSGYWSIPVTNIVNSALTQTAQSITSSNNAKSQANALAQMNYQTEANAKAMAFSSEEAQKNREWQEMMSNTAHQREVKDLLSAGLNPVLSAMGGSGATTPSGASASGVTSSGAMGQVDTSTLSFLGSVLGAVINGNYSKAIAEINQETSLGVAQINAKSQSNVANINAENQQYLAKNYPSNIFNASKYAAEGLVDLIHNGVGEKTGKALSGLFDKLKNISLSNLYKNK